jgi:hypothetical protein
MPRTFKFRLLPECRNSPRMPHNASKNLPPCDGMSRSRVLFRDFAHSRRHFAGANRNRVTPELGGASVIV